MSSEQNVISPEVTDECLQIVVERDVTVNHITVESRVSMERPDSTASEPLRNGRREGEDEDPETGLRLPEMTDTSMDNVGQPLREVMDRLNGSLDAEDGADEICTAHNGPPNQQPFREDAGGEPPDPSDGFLQASLPPADFYCFTSQSPDPAASGGGRHDSAGHGEPQDVPVSNEDEGEAEAEAAAAGQVPSIAIETSEKEQSQTEEEDDKDATHAAEFK